MAHSVCAKEAEETRGTLPCFEDTEVVRKPRSNEDLCHLRCGKCCTVPCVVLQSFATAKWALAMLTVARVVSQVVLNGLIAVTISTLEKRFELRSTESGLIASMSDVGQVLYMCAVILFASSRLDKPQVIGWGVVVMGMASILFAMPHFTAPEYTYINEEILNYCGNVTEPDCDVSSIRNYLYWFIACFIFVGAGSCPLIIQALTYLDENVPLKNSALYNSIFFAVGGCGIAVGFLLGGLTLEVYTYPSIDPDDLTIDTSSYAWVGAWWLGYVVCGIVAVLVGIPVLMLPRYLPGTEKHRRNRNADTQKSHYRSTEENDGKHGLRMVFSDVMMLLKNKPYMIMTVAITTNSALIYGFSTFGAKYLETIFGMTPFHSSLLYGISAFVASFGAQLASGVLVKKFDLQVVGMLKFMIVAGIASAVCSVGFLVHCDDIDVAGGTLPYPNGSDALSVVSSCNRDCWCTTDRYQPVCADGVAYFSPCYAGCVTKLNETAYTDCSCVGMSNASRAGHDVVVSSESCDRNSCDMIIPFAFVIFTCFFTSILTFPPSAQVILRCVPFSKRDLAISFKEIIVLTCGVIPGRVLVGFVLDQGCVAWSTECGVDGSCEVYNRWDVARYNTILLVAQTVLCVICYALALVTYKPVGGDAREAERMEVTELSAGDKSQTEA